MSIKDKYANTWWRPTLFSTEELDIIVMAIRDHQRKMKKINEERNYMGDLALENLTKFYDELVAKIDNLRETKKLSHEEMTEIRYFLRKYKKPATVKVEPWTVQIGNYPPVIWDTSASTPDQA